MMSRDDILAMRTCVLPFSHDGPCEHASHYMRDARRRTALPTPRHTEDLRRSAVSAAPESPHMAERTKLSESCGTNPRNTWKVAPCQKLPKMCSGSSSLGQIGQSRLTLAKVGPNVDKIGRTWANFDQHWPKLANTGQCWSKFAKRWPSLANLAQGLAGVGRMWAETRLLEHLFGSFRATLAKVGQNWPILAEGCHELANVG